jgi:hypothetical protein
MLVRLGKEKSCIECLDITLKLINLEIVVVEERIIVLLLSNI